MNKIMKKIKKIRPRYHSNVDFYDSDTNWKDIFKKRDKRCDANNNVPKGRNINEKEPAIAPFSCCCILLA